MTIQWESGKNPYLHNSFGVLGVGPNTPDNIIAATAENLNKRVKAGSPPELGGEKLDIHQISEASKCLLDGMMRAEHLLIVHPEVKQEQRKLKDVVKKIQETAVLPPRPNPLPLAHPLGILWFVPQPGAEAAAWPPLKEFHLVESGDRADLELDIIFDI